MTTTAPARTRWPKHPEDAPSSDQVARALVVAARLNDDLPALEALAAADDAGRARAAILRCKRYALDALGRVYPRCGLQSLARLLSVSLDGSWLAGRRPAWWSAEIADAVAARV